MIKIAHLLRAVSIVVSTGVFLHRKKNFSHLTYAQHVHMCLFIFDVLYNKNTKETAFFPQKTWFLFNVKAFFERVCTQLLPKSFILCFHMCTDLIVSLNRTYQYITSAELR